MSLNTAHCNGGVLIHQGEVILLHAANAVVTFSGSDELKFGEKAGNAYLTTHRLIFLSGKGHNTGGFQSFSFPFCVLSEVDVEQPMFGANFLKGKIRAQPDGNWRGEAKFKLLFKNGGAIDFAQGMVRAMQLARQMTSQNAYWNTPPPSYSAATAPGTPYQQAPPSYFAGQNNYYGWAPPAYNFPAPEAGTVFVSEAPPPYPGIGAQQQPPAYPQQPAANPYDQFNGGGYPGAPPQQNGMMNGGGGYTYAPQQNGMMNNGGYQQLYQQQPQQYAQQPQQYAQQPQQYTQQPQQYPQQQFGFNMGMGGAPPQATGYYPPPNGNAYANGTQAFVPPAASAPAPPPYAQYDPNSKKND